MVGITAPDSNVQTHVRVEVTPLPSSVPMKLAPDTVTMYPPDDGPDVGSRPVTTGTGRYTKVVMSSDTTTSSDKSENDAATRFDVATGSRGAMQLTEFKDTACACTI